LSNTLYSHPKYTNNLRVAIDNSTLISQQKKKEEKEKKKSKN